MNFSQNLILVIVLGLIMGSFLNVVINRYPTMLKRRWRRECLEFLELPTNTTQEPVYNLAYPSSHCVHCQQPLSFFYNIPLISYLALSGRCGFCQIKISLQYPLIGRQVLRRRWAVRFASR